MNLTNLQYGIDNILQHLDDNRHLVGRHHAVQNPSQWKAKECQHDQKEKHTKH